MLGDVEAPCAVHGGGGADVPSPEEGGFDAAWPGGGVEEEEEEDALRFAGTVADALDRKGWCVVQMRSEPGFRKGAVACALDLVDWRLPKADLEVPYMGRDNITKYADLDPDDVSKEAEDPLAACDRALTDLGILLAPLAPHFLGCAIWGRHHGQARMPFRASEEKFLRPRPISEGDYNAGGVVARHLAFLERRKLLAMYMIDNEGGEILLHPQPGSASGPASERSVRLPLAADTMLVLLPNLWTYTYRPKGRNSLLLQTWYVSEASGVEDGDARAVELPASQQGERVVVSALECRFPGAGNSMLQAWSMWVTGTDGAIQLPHTRFDIDAYCRDDGFSLMYTRHFGGIEEELVMGFDPDFFGLPAREAEGMSPEQRNVLEVGYQTLAAMGYTKESVRGLHLGVYLGDAGTDWKASYSFPELRVGTQGKEVNPYLYSGWQMGVGAARLSHLFGLKGPCFSFDTACSSSLVALGQAARTLVKPTDGQPKRSSAGGSFSQALILGLCLDDGPHTFVGYCAAGMLSHAGRSFTFNETADGFMRGEGCAGAFLQVSDSDAMVQDMMACVVGSNVNQDGRSATMTAPNGPAQQMCIRASMGEAGLRPSDIAIAECHGTGTALGDPIEVGALRDVMKDRGSDTIVMTSGKANFGHMEACAGMGGLATCILMLNSMSGCCNVHLRNINPHIEIVGYPAVFVDENVDIGVRAGIAGVSSFGVGGTNARVDLWGRSRLGYLATTEVVTVRMREARNAAYRRVAMGEQMGLFDSEGLAIELPPEPE